MKQKRPLMAIRYYAKMQRQKDYWQESLDETTTPDYFDHIIANKAKYALYFPIRKEFFYIEELDNRRIYYLYKKTGTSGDYDTYDRNIMIESLKHSDPTPDDGKEGEAGRQPDALIWYNAIDPGNIVGTPPNLFKNQLLMSGVSTPFTLSFKRGAKVKIVSPSPTGAKTHLTEYTAGDSFSLNQTTINYLKQNNGQIVVTLMNWV